METKTPKKTNHNSGDKNCYQFLFKILGKHMKDQKWDEMYRKLKSDIEKEQNFQNQKNQRNIHWKSIFNALIKESMLSIEGVSGSLWKTLTKLLEIASNIENYLKVDGKEVIKWRANKEGGKNEFIKKCSQIQGVITQLLRKGIEENDTIHNKQDFHTSIDLIETNNQSMLNPSYFSPPEEPFYDRDYSEDKFYQNPMKKMKTTEDFTYAADQLRTGQMSEEIFLEYYNTPIENKFGNIHIEEETKENLLNMNSFYSNENSLASQPTNTDGPFDLAADLRRQLEEQKKLNESLKARLSKYEDVSLLNVVESNNDEDDDEEDEKIFKIKNLEHKNFY